MNPWLGAAIGLAVALAATPIAMQTARRTGILDRPGPLKTHTRPVPYLGGTAVFAGLLVVALAADHPLLAVPPALALGVGLADDVRSLPVVVRLVAESGVGVTVGLVAGGHEAWALTLAALVTVVAINAVNFVDGVDGLAAGVGAAGAAGAAVALSGGWSTTAAGLAGAAAGFVAFNRPPARIYLGDAGSYLLGATLAMFAVHVVSDAHRAVPALGVAAIGAYPLVELLSTVARRLLRGRSPFAGDRDHVYDRLGRLRSGLAAVASIVVAHAAVVAAGIAAVCTCSAAGSIAVLAVILALALAVTVAGRKPITNASTSSTRKID